MTLVESIERFKWECNYCGSVEYYKVCQGCGEVNVPMVIKLEKENKSVRKDRRDIADRLEIAQTNYINMRAENEKLKEERDDAEGNMNDALEQLMQLSGEREDVWLPLLEAADDLVGDLDVTGTAIGQWRVRDSVRAAWEIMTQYKRKKTPHPFG